MTMLCDLCKICASIKTKGCKIFTKYYLHIKLHPQDVQALRTVLLKLNGQFKQLIALSVQQVLPLLV